MLLIKLGIVLNFITFLLRDEAATAYLLSSLNYLKANFINLAEDLLFTSRISWLTDYILISPYAYLNMVYNDKRSANNLAKQIIDKKNI